MTALTASAVLCAVTATAWLACRLCAAHGWRRAGIRPGVRPVQQRFVAMVSHELRTPLTAIRGALQLLTEPGALADSAERDALVQTSLHSTERLIRTVNDILDLSAIEAGQLQLRLEACAVPALIDEALQVVGRLAREVGLAIRVDVPADLPPVQVDEDRTVQALVNLLANAVAHSPTGGTITLAAHARGHEVVVSVRDEGAGIAPEHLSAIFEPFTQVDGGSARRSGGSGLGLTITKAFAEAQGGHVRVESTPGHGALFLLALPRVLRQAA